MHSVIIYLIKVFIDKENKIEIDVWDEDDDLFADTSLMNNLDKKVGLDYVTAFA